MDYGRRALSRAMEVAFRCEAVRGYSQIALVAIAGRVVGEVDLTYCLGPFLAYQRTTTAASTSAKFVGLVGGRVQVRLGRYFLRDLRATTYCMLVREFYVGLAAILRGGANLFHSGQGVFQSTTCFATFLVGRSLSDLVALGALLGGLLTIFSLGLHVLSRVITFLSAGG